jgi:hypothetical protein
MNRSSYNKERFIDMLIRDTDNKGYMNRRRKGVTPSTSK